MKRLVAYGDSFTLYNWSTWADLLAKVKRIDLLNRAEGGAANNFISYKISHDIDNGIISSNDSVKIMWSVWNRVVDIKDIKNFTSYPVPIGKMNAVYDQNIKTIQKTEQLLINHQIEYEFLCWMPFNKDFSLSKIIKPFDWNGCLEKPLKLSLFEIVFKNSWLSRQDFAIRFDEIPKSIRKHIEKQAKEKNIEIVDLIRNSDSTGIKKFIFFDLHPTPLHHFEYLKYIYPEIVWPSELIDDINRENQEVLSTLWDLTDYHKNIL